MKRLWKRVEAVKEKPGEDLEDSFESAKDFEDLKNLEDMARQPDKAKFLVSLLLRLLYGYVSLQETVCIGMIECYHCARLY